MIDFVPVWTLILGFAVFAYVLLDGFDLGVGILYNFASDKRARSLMINSIAPIWDGNETWLVLGGLAMPNIAASGITLSASVPPRPRLPKGSCWALSFRALPCRTGISAAAHSTASRLSRFSPGWH
jgi:hypothetical protein